MKYRIALFPGDGVGPELISEGIKAVEKAAELEKFHIEWVGQANEDEDSAKSRQFPEEILRDIKDSCSAIYCGTLDSGIIKNYFEQFLVVRPIKLLPTVESPILGKTHEDIDFLLIRENSEDFYVGLSGRAKNGRNRQQHEISRNKSKIRFGLNIECKDDELSYQIGILTKKACERVIRFAFEQAVAGDSRKITFVDKANLLDSYSFWRDNVNSIAKQYPDVEYEFNLVDATLVNLIRKPDAYEIIVAPNMFGDILGGLGTIIQGGLSFAARANICPEKISMFEPIHGSAPKLRGQGIVNPIATIWAGALMLENIGQKKAGSLILKAIESVLKDGKTRTQDLDGNNTSSEMGDAIVDKMIDIHE